MPRTKQPGQIKSAKTNGKGKVPKAAPPVMVARMMANAMQGLGVTGNTDDNLILRSRLQGLLGQQYGTDRDVYKALGYPQNLTFSELFGVYIRQDIASRIVDAYPNATWKGIPKVIENSDPDETDFEKAVNNLMNKSGTIQFLTRIDRIAGIGQYGVLFIGFNDPLSATPEKPVEQGSAKKILFMRPFTQTNADIATWDTDTSSPRFGLPETYTLKVVNIRKLGTADSEADQPTETKLVHWTRTVHVADLLTESNVFGRPRLERVFNRLLDLAKISGGSAEMFWRGAFPGLSFELDPEVKLSADQKTALQNEITDYVHSMNRYLLLQGVKTNTLQPNIADPGPHFDIQMKLISGATGIPVRILTGSERGELASTQDQENWNERVDERRTDFAEPIIFRPLISRLQFAGVIPGDEETMYSIEWPEADLTKPTDKADIISKLTKALKDYVESGAEIVIPPIDFLVEVMGFSQDVADRMLERVKEMIGEEQVDEEEVEQMVEDEMTAEGDQQ